MSLMETSQCHTNQVKSLIQHLYTKDSVLQDQWAQPQHEKNKKKGFRSKHGVDTSYYQSLPTPLSIEEFIHYGPSNHYSPLLPQSLMECTLPSSQTSTSSLSASWSSASSSPDLDNEVSNGWLSDFRSFSSPLLPTTATYHPKSTLFLDQQKPQQHAYIRYPLSPTSVATNTHLLTTKEDDLKNWETAFEWYENNNDTTCSTLSDTTTHHLKEDIPVESKDIFTIKQENEPTENSIETRLQAIDWHKMGMELQEMDQDEAAIDAFRQSLELDPTLLDGWLGLAISYTNEHERGKVYDCLESWLDHNDKYKHLYNDDATIMKDRHTILVDRFLEAARCEPGHASTSIDADIQIILGLLFYLVNDTQKSRDCFHTALACRPEDHRLWNQLGSIFMMQPTLYDNAMDMYWTALDLNPHYIRARYNLAILYMKLADYDQAALHLTKALYQQKQQQQQQQQKHTAMNPSPMWSSLRLVMYMLNLDHLADACNRYDLTPFESFLGRDHSQ